MTICDNCIHRDVCTDEGHLEESLTFCADKIEERPQGTWISSTDGYRCDNCYGKLWYRSNYCPNCGADMRGGGSKELKEEDLGAYANYDKCVPCVYMSFHGCTRPFKDDMDN